MSKLNVKMIAIVDKTIKRLDEGLDSLIAGDMEDGKGNAIANMSGKLLDGIVIRLNRDDASDRG